MDYALINNLKLNSMSKEKVDMYYRYDMVYKLKNHLFLPILVGKEKINPELMDALEDILLGSGNPLYSYSKQYQGYDYLEKLLKSRKHEKNYEKSLKLKEKHHVDDINMNSLLATVYKYIKVEQADTNNRDKKIQIIKQYISMEDENIIEIPMDKMSHNIGIANSKFINEACQAEFSDEEKEMIYTQTHHVPVKTLIK